MTDKREVSWIWKLLCVIMLIGGFILVSSAFLYQRTMEDAIPEAENSYMLTAKELLDDYNPATRQFESYKEGDIVYIRDMVVNREYDGRITVVWFSSTGPDYEYSIDTEMWGLGDLRGECEIGNIVVAEIRVYEGVDLWHDEARKFIVIAGIEVVG